MANENNNNHTVAEIKQFFSNQEMYAKAKDSQVVFRNVNKYTNPAIQAIDKDELKRWIRNVGGNEKNLRNTARYLYYRSNIFFRLVNWYASMFNLNCRKITPKFDIVKEPTEATSREVIKSYASTLDALDILNLQGNMLEVLITVFREDVYYGIILKDDQGSFFYQLDPDECIIKGKYYMGSYSFAVDMSKWRNAQRQEIINFIGEPLKSMYAQYEKDPTNNKYVEVPAEYSVCFKFRTDTYNMVIPPFLPLFLQIAGLEDLVDIQAEADALSIYKLIYMEMETLSGAHNADDFAVSPDLSIQYLQRMIDEKLIPDNVSAAAVPGKLQTIDFEKGVDKDTNSVEISSNQILQTAGGGAVINANKITSTAAFNAWLKAETEFAISPLISQIDGFCNIQLATMLKHPSTVKHFELSVYTQPEVADNMLTSCQYGYSNRLAYGTLIGISEKEQLAQIYLETEVLRLQDKMIYPLSSSFTTSNDGYTPEVGQGAPTKDDTELTPEGDRSRNR